MTNNSGNNGKWRREKIFINNTTNTGPTGIPEIDSLNGYRGRTNHQNDDTMGDPLDFETMNTDFDFAGNLALFNKAVCFDFVDFLNKKDFRKSIYKFSGIY